MNHKVIYLTGAPATGKSTLTENLKVQIPELNVFTYSKELLEWLKEKNNNLTSQDDLRRESAQVITREDVQEVDRQLLELVKTTRQSQSTIIDSHPVTIEQFGFRVTPFSRKQLSELKPDIVICLYADPEIITSRIKANASGRPLPTISELNFHMHLQAQVASQYAFEIDCSLYFLNADCSREELMNRFLAVSKLK